jgi:transcriptional regulator with XRE-family HTH domain
VNDQSPGGGTAASDVPRLSQATARQRLGVLLHDVRTAAGLTLTDAARPLQRTAPTISRLENGKVTPRLLDVRALLDVYAEAKAGVITDEIRELVDLLAEAGRRPSWFSPYGDVLSGPLVNEDHRRFLQLEAEASMIQSFQPDVVPGLLQTRAYVQAIADTYYPRTSQRERERFVAFRLERQQAVAERGSAIDVHVVIGEQALRRSIGGPAVLREQLGALVDKLRDDSANIRIQIAPMNLTVRGAIGGPFLVMRFSDEKDVDFVYLEGRSGADYLESPDDIEQYRDQFDDLADSALDHDASIAAIEEAIKAMA